MPSRTHQFQSSSRRGGVYILVLGAATMISVVGLAAILVARSSIRQTTSARNWNQAGLMAQSAVDAGLAAINTNSNWRNVIVSGDNRDVATFSTGKASFRVVDTTDGQIATGPYDPITITGIGQAGDARRLFSLQARYTPPPVYDALKYAVYSQLQLTTAGTVTVSGAPLRTANSLSNSGTLTSDVQALGVSNTGTIVGYVQTGVPQLLQTQNGNLSSLEAVATAIPYSALTGGNMAGVLLSPTSNPYGAPNARGIYSLSVPVLGRVRIRQSRIAATLIVRLAATANLSIEQEVNWDRPSNDLPTLVVIPTLSIAASVSISSTPTVLDEATHRTNFNPAGSPYLGVSDTDLTDAYPSVIRGIIHIVGPLTTLTVDSATIEGIILADGSVTLNNGTTIAYDANILKDPPPFYTLGSATMQPVPGTWTWVTEP